MNSFFKTRKLEKNTQTVENSDSILVLLFISIFIYLYTYVSPTILISNCSFSGLCMAFMAVSISADPNPMLMKDRPKQTEEARQARQQATTQKPEVTTEDTANRILSLPVEDKCANRK